MSVRPCWPWSNILFFFLFKFFSFWNIYLSFFWKKKNSFLRLRTLHYSHLCLGIFFREKSIIIPVFMREHMKQAKMQPESLCIWPEILKNKVYIWRRCRLGCWRFMWLSSKIWILLLWLLPSLVLHIAQVKIGRIDQSCDIPLRRNFTFHKCKKKEGI